MTAQEYTLASMGPSVSKMEGEGKWGVFRYALTVAHKIVDLRTLGPALGKQPPGN